MAINRLAESLRTIIKAHRMPLSEVSERINTLYIGGQLTAAERAELTELMHSEATPESEMGGWEQMYRALAAKMATLNETVNALGARLSALEGGGSPATGDAAATVPEWEPWDGVSAGYAYGDVVTHGGRYWVSELVSMANVWEPGALGVDERYWREITEAEALAAANQ